jgi:hypothetical protein
MIESLGTVKHRRAIGSGGEGATTAGHCPNLPRVRDDGTGRYSEDHHRENLSSAGSADEASHLKAVSEDPLLRLLWRTGRGATAFGRQTERSISGVAV